MLLVQLQKQMRIKFALVNRFVVQLCGSSMKTESSFVSDIAIFVLKRDLKLQLTN